MIFTTSIGFYNNVEYYHFMRLIVHCGHLLICMRLQFGDVAFDCATDTCSSKVFVEPIEVEGGRLRDPNSVHPSVRDAYKNLNNFAATCPFRATIGW